MQDLTDTSLLLDGAIIAHGGIERWSQIQRIDTTAQVGGSTPTLVGQPAMAGAPIRFSINTREQAALAQPFLNPGQFGEFTPSRTAIVSSSTGVICEELNDPGASFSDPSKPWTAAQAAYFAGYAMWTYLTLPFSLLRDGVRCQEVGVHHEDGETWRTLKFVLPKSFVSHAAEQTLYIDEHGLIRRHDYGVDILGGSVAAHYLFDHQSFDGIVFPVRRRVHPLGPEGQVLTDQVLIALDLKDFDLSRPAFF